LVFHLGFEPRFSEEFEADVENLDGSVREIAGKRVKKILDNPFLSKPLKGSALRFSERFLQYRIIFQVSGGKIIFQRLKKRDEVYR